MDSLPFYQEADVASGTDIWTMSRCHGGHLDELCGFSFCVTSVSKTSLSEHQCPHPLTKGIAFDDAQSSFQMYNSLNVNTLYQSLAVASDGIQMSLWASVYQR